MKTLREFDPGKADWISTASITFYLLDGYLIKELDDLYVEFRGLSIKLRIKGCPDRDIFSFSRLFIDDSYERICAILKTAMEHTCVAPHIVDLDGTSALWPIYLKRNIPNASVCACTFSKNEFDRYTENVQMNMLDGVAVACTTTVAEFNGFKDKVHHSHSIDLLIVDFSEANPLLKRLGVELSALIALAKIVIIHFDDRRTIRGITENSDYVNLYDSDHEIWITRAT